MHIQLRGASAHFLPTRLLPPAVSLQLIIPPELGYPLDDPKHDKVGPKPSTFSGQRALDFVLQNPVR